MCPVSTLLPCHVFEILSRTILTCFSTACLYGTVTAILIEVLMTENKQRTKKYQLKPLIFNDTSPVLVTTVSIKMTVGGHMPRTKRAPRETEKLMAMVRIS
ncbi:hypothetical protein L596_020898 [Steinernema carpocapsae]|uniref:Uncharacterized protein n=1 Tax=Steinernema carpocapsae TaxID=34508 RepID=A0A4U5MVM1_STECR|nr:hypothetical protein L596_020898 [Steinernema carpocapsae]